MVMWAGAIARTLNLMHAAARKNLGGGGGRKNAPPLKKQDSFSPTDAEFSKFSLWEIPVVLARFSSLPPLSHSYVGQKRAVVVGSIVQ